MANKMEGNEDAELVYDIVESMYAGITVMKQGEQKATDSAVKALASKLDKEHSALTAELKELAGKKGWPLPDGESEEDSVKREELANEEDTEYDRMWLEALEERHEENIEKMEDADIADPDLKAAGDKAVPKVRQLLEDIRQVQKELE